MTYQVTADRFSPAEYVRQQYRVVVPVEVTFEQTLEPAFWAHIAHKLQPFDEVTVYSENLSWRAELLVLQSGRLFAKVTKLTYLEMDPNAIKEQTIVMGDHTVEWGTVQTKWRVRRGKDVLRDKFATRPEAVAWLEEHLKNTKAA